MQTMTNFGYNNRWIRLVKDLVFACVSIWIMLRFGILGAILGALAAYWYGRDAYFQAKALWQEKTYRPAAPKEPESNDAKIQVTDLSSAKEVNFEKEKEAE